MALTSRVIFSAYGNGIGKTGKTMSLPSALTTFEAVSPTRTVGAGDTTATIRSVVRLLPTGLNQPGKGFDTPSTTAELASNGS